MVLLSHGCRVGVADLVTFLPQDALRGQQHCCGVATLLWLPWLMAAPGYIAPITIASTFPVY